MACNSISVFSLSCEISNISVVLYILSQNRKNCIECVICESCGIRVEFNKAS
jgi:hypothetical protein